MLDNFAVIPIECVCLLKSETKENPKELKKKRKLYYPTKYFSQRNDVYVKRVLGQKNLPSQKFLAMKMNRYCNMCRLVIVQCRITYCLVLYFRF